MGGKGRANGLVSHRGRRVETVSSRHELVARLKGVLPRALACIRQIDPKNCAWCSANRKTAAHERCASMSFDRVGGVFNSYPAPP